MSARTDPPRWLSDPPADLREPLTRGASEFLARAPHVSQRERMWSQLDGALQAAVVKQAAGWNSVWVGIGAAALVAMGAASFLGLKHHAAKTAQPSAAVSEVAAGAVRLEQASTVASAQVQAATSSAALRDDSAGAQHASGAPIGKRVASPRASGGPTPRGAGADKATETARLADGATRWVQAGELGSRRAAATAEEMPSARRAIDAHAQPAVVGPARRAKTAGPARASAEQSGGPRTGAQPAAAPSASELDLLVRARRLVRSAPERALQLAEQHRELFPRGTFAEERELLAIESLRKLGQRDLALQRATSFRAAFPTSAHLRRIEALSGSE